MERVHSFRVFGDPVPQGSMKAFVVKGRPILTSTSKNLKEWRNLVAYQANSYITENSLVGFYANAEPVKVVAKFYFARPKSHFKASGELRLRAPRFKRTRPDIDKLARAVLDALTGVFFEDDSQVVFLQVEKEYAELGEGPGVEISIEERRTRTDE